jgi:ABC transport system ATP-binding/permease protein
VRLPYYIFAKMATLALFAAVQCALFILIGNAILEVRGMFWTYFGFNFITALTGVALGLVVSSLVADGKTAANLVPLILIPQIILGGALIKYEEMNRDLDILHRFSRWFVAHPNELREANKSKLQVPLICELVPMRWSYEALVVAQAKNNPLTYRQERIQDQIDKLVGKPVLSPAETERLDDLKETLALVSGLESGSPDEVDRRLKRVDQVLDGANPSDVKLRSKTFGVTGETLYVNQKITDLVAKAETEQFDYRRQHRINVFFSPQKYFGSFSVSVLATSTIMLLGFAGGAIVALYFSLRRQLSTRVE